MLDCAISLVDRSHQVKGRHVVLQINEGCALLPDVEGRARGAVRASRQSFRLGVNLRHPELRYIPAQRLEHRAGRPGAVGEAFCKTGDTGCSARDCHVVSADGVVFVMAQGAAAMAQQVERRRPATGDTHEICVDGPAGTVSGAGR